MDRSNIEKIARTSEEKFLLARLWDKIQAGMTREIPAATPFLTPHEQQMARYLFGDAPGLRFCGGYADAERKILLYTPEYMPASADGAIACLRVEFYHGDSPTHRDFLGALLGLGVARDTLGDILVGAGSCDFFATAEVAPFLLQNFRSAGRTAVRLSQIPLADVAVPEANVRQLRNTLASLRLDGVVSAGFGVSRAAASQAIRAGKVSVDGLTCEKPDWTVGKGMKVSLRGSGKIQLAEVGGETKKGRISVCIHRYL
ncbi:MAG: YlmH/Sll1252 family protein [Firmicutes bacterium]|nr:YlmH/Sll1252 family protein [Bacillota bacterium]